MRPIPTGRGVAEQINPKLLHLVCDSGHIPGGFATWVRLHGVPGRDVAILNIYAPHTSTSRCNLWIELLAKLPRDCRWICTRDWNFVETNLDKSNLRAPSTSEAEKRMFREFKETFHVRDCFPASNRIKYSWDSRRGDGARMLARLDRTYTFTVDNEHTTHRDYHILGDSAHSDHLAVWRRVWLEKEVKRSSQYIMNSAFLKDPVVNARIHEIWNKQPSLPFYSKLRHCVKYYKEFCIKKAQERRATELAVRKRMENTVIELQNKPENSGLQEEFANTERQLKDFEKWKLEGLRLRSRLKWRKAGDQGSKEFFLAHRARSMATNITELDDEAGITHTSQTELGKICQSYYSKLYKARPPSAESREAENHALSFLSDKIPAQMREKLQAPISAVGLKTAVMEMKAGKAPGPDGITLEFFQCYWGLIGEDFAHMIQESIQKGRLPTGVTRGMITLLHKGGPRKALTNWRSITLLNMGYKFFAKALQLRLQPVLMEIISFDQSAFLPMRFILDNLLLTQETMAWAEQSHQDLLFLKLDFSKAYNMVDWECLFRIMDKMGFPREFILMLSMLFKDAAAAVKVYGVPSPLFDIERGVRQGCPLAPYLFLIIAEVLNIMVKEEMVRGNIQGISLPFLGRQQVVAQYADDTSFTLLGEEVKVRYLISTLNTFCLATGLVLNWSKSSGYWKSGHTVGRPAWTEDLGITWASNDSVSKLLGAPFGLSLTTHDVNEFLHNRLTKKLTHWSTRKINPTGRAIVANSILLSSIFFFLSVWGGTKQGIARIKSTVANYLASGKASRSRARVGWIQSCQPKKDGGINLINPHDAVSALMTKWIIKAMEPGQSNLHLLLRHKLSQYQPYSGGRWSQSLEFFLVPQHQARSGSIVWNRVTAAWKSLRPISSYKRPQNWEELMNSSWWWCPAAPIIEPGFSRTRAAALHRARLRRYRDAWVQGRLMNAAEASVAFGRQDQEWGA